MWRKRIFKWQPSKLLWIWIFRAVAKERTTEKNYYLGRLLWSCLKPPADFAEREKKLYWRLDCCNEYGCIACILVACDLYSSCRINKPQLSIGEGLGEWLRNHEEIKQHVSSFVAGQGTLVPCIFMCFSINFQTSSCGFFVCLLFSRWNCVF